jgi:hypothetical protein
LLLCACDCGRSRVASFLSQALCNPHEVLESSSIFHDKSPLQQLRRRHILCLPVTSASWSECVVTADRAVLKPTPELTSFVPTDDSSVFHMLPFPPGSASRHSKKPHFALLVNLKRPCLWSETGARCKHSGGQVLALCRKMHKAFQTYHPLSASPCSQLSCSSGTKRSCGASRARSGRAGLGLEEVYHQRQCS